MTMEKKTETPDIKTPLGLNKKPMCPISGDVCIDVKERNDLDALKDITERKMAQDAIGDLIIASEGAI